MKKGSKRVAILDFDAHAGNGTEEILYQGLDMGKYYSFLLANQVDPVIVSGSVFAKRWEMVYSMGKS